MENEAVCIVVSDFFSSNEKIIKMNMQDQEKYGISSTTKIILKANNERVSIGTVQTENVKAGSVSLSSLIFTSLHIKNGDTVYIQTCTYPEAIPDTIMLEIIMPKANIPEDIRTEIIARIKSDFMNVPFINREYFSLPFKRAEYSSMFIFQIKSPQENHILLFAQETRFQFQSSVNSYKNLKTEDIVGLEVVKEQLYTAMIKPFKHLTSTYPLIRFPQGIIIYGANGCGKTSLVKAIANEHGCTLINKSVADIINKHYGEGEKALRSLFQQANSSEKPCVILFEDSISIFGKNWQSLSDMELRLTSELFTQMDSITENIRVVLELQDISELNPMFRKSNHFAYEIAVDPPSKKDRLKIVQAYTKNTISTSLAKEIAEKSNGFTGSDLQLLLCHALFHAEQSNNKEEIQISREDILFAFSKVSPSISREYFGQIPDVCLEDIIGLKDAKQAIEESVIWRLKPPKAFMALKSEFTNGILLYGLPGCGKTMLGQAIAHDSGCNFFYIKGPEIISKWLGESMRTLRQIFSRAKRSQPAIIFIDEIDAITAHRTESSEGGEKEAERLVNQLLAELNGLEKTDNIVVIGATNRPDRIDTAVIRNERFDIRIFVNPPSLEDRILLFQKYITRHPHNPAIKYDFLAKITDKYTGADIHTAVKHATNKIVREIELKLKRECQIEQEDIEWVLKNTIHASMTQEDIDRYQQFAFKKKEISHDIYR